MRFDGRAHSVRQRNRSLCDENVGAWGEDRVGVCIYQRNEMGCAMLIWLMRVTRQTMDFLHQPMWIHRTSEIPANCLPLFTRSQIKTNFTHYSHCLRIGQLLIGRWDHCEQPHPNPCSLSLKDPTAQYQKIPLANQRLQAKLFEYYVIECMTWLVTFG